MVRHSRWTFIVDDDQLMCSSLFWKSISINLANKGMRRDSLVLSPRTTIHSHLNCYIVSKKNKEKETKAESREERREWEASVLFIMWMSLWPAEWWPWRNEDQSSSAFVKELHFSLREQECESFSSTLFLPSSPPFSPITPAFLFIFGAACRELPALSLLRFILSLRLCCLSLGMISSW